MTMVMNPTETSLKDIVNYVDFREYFVDREYIKTDMNDNIRIQCPNPGCYSPDKCYVYSANVFCQKCRTRWTMYDWLTEVEGIDRLTAVGILQELAGEEPVREERNTKKIKRIMLDDEQVRYLTGYAYEAHNNLTEETVKWWHNRGVNDTAINEFVLGEYNGWYTMPARDDRGTVFSVKKRWKGTKEDSPHNTRYECARGSKVTYAPWILRGEGEEFAIVTGGEIKGLALWCYLQERNIPWSVITISSGENIWQPHWNQIVHFARVAIWPDKDDAGIAFARHIQQNYRNDASIIFPKDSDAKSVDDYILEGKDPIREIAKTMRFSGIR